MISGKEITVWGASHPWQDADQVEQDLLLSRAMLAIAKHPLLGKELVLRGGTAFHKLFLPEPYRYSEDLDYVRMTSGGIGDTMKALTALGRGLGFEVRTSMQRHPKVFWRYTSVSGNRRKIKIEMDTYERSPAMPITSIPHAVACGLAFEEGVIPVFQAEELAATKIRALYQRSKGRDLYDIWLALEVLGLDPDTILAAFPVYRPAGLTAGVLERNLSAKLEDPAYRSDTDLLRRMDSPEYDPQQALEIVLEKIVRRLDTLTGNADA